MERSNERILFEHAVAQLEEAELDASTWTIGGGTILKEYLHHRFSKDIDIFISDPQLLGYLSPRLNYANDSDIIDYSESGNVLQITFAEGKVDFIVAKNITDITPRDMIFHGKRVRVDDAVEIVAKKIYYRADHFHPRDCFDLACLYMTDRNDDMVRAGIDMLDKIDILAQRILHIQQDEHFLKIVQPSPSYQDVIKKTFENVEAYIEAVYNTKRGAS